jgi:DNA-binding IclR family transcriptional regulator
MEALMIKLNNAQLAVLSAASQRRDRAVAFPEEMAQSERVKLAKGLVKKSLIEEVQSKGRTPVHRRDDGGRKISLVVTAAGLEAIAHGVDASEGQVTSSIEDLSAKPPRRARKGRDRVREDASSKVSARRGASAPVGAIGPNIEAASSGATAREGSKTALVLKLLGRAEGAALQDLVTATGWLPHTTRAALTGLRKRGYAVRREKRAGGPSVYRVNAATARG